MIATTAAIVAGLSATAAADTVFGALVFTRHGDRTAKFFNNAVLTNLGADQTYNSGAFFRNRYIANGSEYQIAGISADKVNPGQVWASAPDSGVLYESATHFLQGLYPPLGTADGQELSNGTETYAPLGGYQFILVNGEDTNSPDTIWLQGSTGCPAFTTASSSYSQSAAYQSLMNSTTSFYSQFSDILGPIIGTSNLTYKNAYTIFDLLNVASIHNITVAPNISTSALDEARYLADAHEFNAVYNSTQNMRSISGQTLAGQILSQLNNTVYSNATHQKFTLLAGSYDLFQAFFGLTNLTSASPNFYGLPAYAAQMVFELFVPDSNASFPTSPSTDLRVRFYFKNGTQSDIEQFPLFGTQDQDMSYGDFVSELGARSVGKLPQWCGMCGSTEAFCVAANQTSDSTSPSSGGAGSSSSSSGSHGSSLSNAAAGGIGAGVTLGVVFVVAGLAFLLTRGRRNRNRHAAPAAVGGTAATTPAGLEKRPSNSESESSV